MELHQNYNFYIALRVQADTKIRKGVAGKSLVQLKWRLFRRKRQDQEIFLKVKVNFHYR